MKKQLIYLLVIFNICLLKAQNIEFKPDGSALFVGSNYDTLTFKNARLKYVDLLKLNSDVESGLIADIYTQGGAILEVYGGVNKNVLIFKKKLLTSSTTFSGETELVDFEGVKVHSDNTKLLASKLAYTTKDQSKCSAITDPTLFKASIISAGGEYFFKSPYNDCLKDNNFNQEQLVDVKVYARKALVKRLKIPGQAQELILGELNPDKSFSVTLFINGISQGAVSPGRIPTFNAKVGDEIKFVFNNAFASNNRKPIFEGIPAVWIAHFGGETKYMCTPSIQPNELKPWIGFDSQVHGSLLRRFPPKYKQRFADFERDASGNIVSWTFTLQREMDPNMKVYTPAYKWPKEKTTPVKQRNNQKEGLNLELLQAFNDPFYKSYSGNRHILGSDPDEIFYLGGQNPDTKKHPPSHGLLRKTDEVWKTVTYNESEEPINDVVSAYIKNRMALSGGYDVSSVKYDSYEIQDKGTSPALPEGNKTGNVKAPGLCKIRVGTLEVIFNLNVVNSLSNQNGFYANINGTRWPEWNESPLYSFTGFSGKTVADLRKYFMVYSYENSISNRFEDIKYLKSLSDAELQKISREGDVTYIGSPFMTDFHLGGNGYSNVTLYKYNSNNTDSVIVGGKELLTVVLRFVTVPNGNPGLQLNEVADGGYIQLEDFRNDRETDPLYISRYGRYVKKFMRQYTLNKGSTLTFYTLDSDPFTFFNTGTEWYLSSRYQAKRLPLTGDDSQATYVKYYLDPLNPDGSVKTLTTNPVGSGSTFSYTYNSEGDYQLRVVYRTGLIEAFHRIKVVNYTGNRKGTIKKRAINDREKRLLGVSSNFLVYDVDDILAQYRFVDGFRSQNPANRFGPFNDYYDVYTWETSSGQIIKSDQFILDFVNNYSESSWAPSNWVRHFSDKPYPLDIDPLLFKTINESKPYLEKLFANVPEPWQVRLPWGPVTNAIGQRFRTNIKVVYDMNKYFDNNSGAFSGNPKAISTTEVYNSFINDDQEDLKELVNDIRLGRKIIVNNNAPLPTNCRVKNTSNKSGIASVLIAEGAPATRAPMPTNNEEIAKVNEQADFKIYPNPVRDILNVQLPNIQAARIKLNVFSISGKMILSKYWLLGEENVIHLNVSDYDSGEYLLVVECTECNWSQNAKFIVK